MRLNFVSSAVIGSEIVAALKQAASSLTSKTLDGNVSFDRMKTEFEI